MWNARNMNQEITILRHAETEIVSTTPIQDWHLTEDGTRRSQELAETGVFDHIEHIFTSNEYKAHYTALPIAERLGLKIVHVPTISELFRGSPLLSNEEYISRVGMILSYPPKHVDGWEDPDEALSRFKNAIDEIAQKGDNILVVSHGLVMSLYFSELLGLREMAFNRWKQLKFLSWGIVTNGEVLKDIV